MAEIQQSTNSADLTQRFIELVMMNAQQAALCLGQMPHPSTGKADINLDAAKMFIDHLETIREKTRGNLSKEEEKILTSVLSELQIAFVQVSSGTRPAHDEPYRHGEEESVGDNRASPAHPSPPSSDVGTPRSPTTLSTDEEGKKKFSKSYGS